MYFEDQNLFLFIYSMRIEISLRHYAWLFAVAGWVKGKGGGVEFLLTTGK